MHVSKPFLKLETQGRFSKPEVSEDGLFTQPIYQNAGASTDAFSRERLINSLILRAPRPKKLASPKPRRMGPISPPPTPISPFDSHANL